MLSLPRLPAHWAPCLGPPPTCCGRGCVGVGCHHCPFGLHAVWGLRAAGVVGGRPRGGVACHHCEGRLVSGAVPPPAARPLERAARVPRPVCPGCGRCGRGDPALAPRRAPLRAAVARRGGGGRASPGGLPSAAVRGVWGHTLPLLRLPAIWAGCRGSLGVCGVCGVCAVRVVVRAAALLLSLWCSPLRCLGAVLCSPCACRAPFPARAPCSAAGYPLFLSWLRCSLPFPLPFSLACTFSLPPLWCVSRSFSLPARRSLSLGLFLLDLRRERMQTDVRRRGFCRAMAPCRCHPRSVSYSCGGVVCYLLMLCSCAPLSFLLPCCACYGVFYRASFGVGLYPTCSRDGSTHLFGRHLCSLSVPRARRDMQHTCEGDKL